MLARTLEKYLIFAADVVSFNLAFLCVFWIRYQSGWLPEHYDPLSNFKTFSQIAFVLSLVWIAYFYVNGLYRDWYLESRSFQIYVVTKKITVGVVVILLLTAGDDIISVLQGQPVGSVFTKSRILCSIGYWLSFVISVNAFRMLVQAAMRRLLRVGYGLDRVLVLGANEAGYGIQKALEETPTWGWQVDGYIDEQVGAKNRMFHQKEILGKYSDLPQLIPERNIGGIIISHESTSHNEILRILSHVAEFPVKVFVVPDLYDAVGGHFKTSVVHGIPLKTLFADHMPAWEAQIKRLFDIAFSVSLLCLSSPVLLLVSILIKLDSKGPILYSQERIGQYGRRFMIHKFRSMRQDAEAAGPQWAKDHDPRITKVGRFLRFTRLDEIPQLWNILRGEMSLVGPRPEREHFIKQLRQEIPIYLRRLKMKPGLTGWAQVKHKYDTSFEDVKTKVSFDLWYFDNMSLSLDFQILIRTIWVVLTGHGSK